MLKGAPRINRPRNRYQMNHDVGTTFDAARLIPLTWYEILPGDTVSNLKLSYIVRMLTPLNPVMDNAYLRCDAFFVPYEIVWQYAKQFFGEVDPGTWNPTSLNIPYFAVSQLTGVGPGSIGDYLGMPTGSIGTAGPNVSALPLRSYLRIYNYWYRDELTMNAVLFPTDGGSTFDSTLAYQKFYSDTPLPTAKLPDYFTTCLPFTSKIAPVEMGGKAPVVTDTTLVPNAGVNQKPMQGVAVNSGGAVIGPDLYVEMASSIGGSVTASNSVGSYNFAPTNLWAQNASLTVETLRRAIVYQHVGEILARGGSRYASEFLKNIFGVENSESLYSEPEYLGGFERPINMTEVLSNADTGSSGREVGENGAMSKTTGNDFVCDHTFTRHGIMMILATIRKPENYFQGWPRRFTKLSFWDHYLPQAQGLGFQKVYKHELYAPLGSDGQYHGSETFGFQDYGAEYRFQPNVLSGYMRPNVTGALSTWTWSQVYSDVPTLNNSFMEADNTGFNRTLAVSSTHQFFGNFHIQGTWTRVVGVQRFPGLDKI